MIKNKLMSVLLLAFCTAIQSSFAGVLTPSGTWNETTIIRGQTENVKITAKVTVAGTITVAGTLSICADASRLIQRKADFQGALFQVNRGGILYIDCTDNAGTPKTGNKVTIDGNIDNVNALMAMIYVAPGGVANIRGATLQNNRNIYNSSTVSDQDLTCRGGAIRNEGTCRLWNTTLSGNVRRGDRGLARGGAISSAGNLLLNGCTVESNRCVSPNGDNTFGGGLQIDSFRDNMISNKTVTSTITNCKINGNSADFGGGLSFGTQQPDTTSPDRPRRQFPYVLNLRITGDTQIANNTANKAGGGIFCSNQYMNDWVKVTITMDQGTISGNKAVGGYPNTKAGGGGIYASDISQITFTPGRAFNIYNNSATGLYGGGMYIVQKQPASTSSAVYNYPAFYKFTADLNAGNLYGNSAASGAGVYIDSTAVSPNIAVNVSGVDIHDNVASANGGGLFIQNGNLTVSGGRAYGNRASANGGAFYMGAGSVKLADGTVSGNSARNGAGLFVLNTAVTIQGGGISDNVATANGGGVYTQGSGNSKTMTIRGGTVTGNRAGANGGGLYVVGSSSGEAINMTSGSISANQAKDGAGLYISNQTFTATGGNILRNVASGRGGGMCLSVASTTTLGGTVNISYNVATNLGGGVVMNNNSTLTINNGTFSYNLAQMGGGAHLLGGATLTINGGNFFCNRAVYVEGGDRRHTGDGEKTEPCVWTTAYATERYDICSGVGGGIYLGKGFDETHVTTLNCPKSDRTGLVGAYSNVADRAGNEIVSAGVWTKVTLPNRVLEDGEGRILHWFEDYYTDDTRYAERWKNAPEGTTVGMRYRDAAATGIQQRVWEATAQTGCPYLCLTLGYAVDMPVNSLWITDHADAGDGMVHLAFQPIFENTVDMAIWIPYARTNNLVRYVAADTEAELASAPLKDDFTFRDGTGDQDAAKGWCWITVPGTNKLCKVVICNKELGGVQL